MRTADLIAERLAASGIRHAFGIPGGEVLILIDALRRAGIAFVTARHETAAGLMAEGSAAHTAAPGLLLVTVGPGVSNAVNAVANAFLDRVPLIVLSGAIDHTLKPAFTHQVLDHGALLRPVTKATFVAAPETIDATMQRALALAMEHPRGPVHIDVPVHVAGAEIGAVDRRVSSAGDARDAASHTREECSDEALRDAARWLRHATRPLVIAGLEAVQDGVPAALAELLRVTGAPLLTTYKAKGVIDELDPQCVGPIALSPRADAIVAPLIEAADVVLLVGYDPVEMRVRYVQPFAAHTRVVELAPCRRAHAMHEAHVLVVGELCASLRELSRELAADALRPCWPDGMPRVVRATLRSAFAPAPGFTPRTVVDTLARVIPPDVRMTVDTGAHRILLSQCLPTRRPRQLLQSNGLCTMGYALPAAIGLALSSGERVVAIMGDGGFEMVVGELATLRDLGLKLTIVVFDDQSLALIDQKQQAEHLPRNGVWLGATDHAAVASAFGGRGERIGSAEGLARALRDSLASTRGFTLISCALERGAYEGLL
jgi:acetolactate synthase-1/2/3 large subunit